MTQKIKNSTIHAYNGREFTRVSSALSFADTLSGWKVRWGFGRMNYMVEPGLYAVGNPDSRSDVFVTANYKMSFDRLRSVMVGRDAWILVLDTKGINVWCAAGKGTFGTVELVGRIQAVRLHEVVEHRNLILPQLGATGVSAHQVKSLTGFKVNYGPVRAHDLPAFLDAGKKAAPEMRKVQFPIVDRLVLVPLELVSLAVPVFFAGVFFFLLAGLSRSGYSGSMSLSVGLPTILVLFIAYLVGGILGPALLPWLPGRAFYAKGLWVGGLVSILVWLVTWNNPGLLGNQLSIVAWMLIAPALTSFMVMNFTGASTYTSLSGVQKEMRTGVPIQIVGAVAGLSLWLVGRFV